MQWVLWVEALLRLLTVASLLQWLRFHCVAPRIQQQSTFNICWSKRSQATISIKSVVFLFAFKIHVANRLLLCISNNIVICVIRCSVAAQTSRAANVAVHVLLRRYVFDRPKENIALNCKVYIISLFMGLKRRALYI